MIKEAMEYLLGLKEPHYLEFGNRKYTDKSMSALRAEAEIAALSTSTLQSIVDYIKEEADAPGVYGPDRLIIQVAGADKVCLYDELNSDGFRQCRIAAQAELPQLRLNDFRDLEQLNIMLQSNFVESPERALVLGLLGNISDGQVRELKDDGVSQEVAVKAGVRRVDMETVPNPVHLAPYRTFAEVEQPASLFVLRLQSGAEAPRAALFEADGGAWRLAARRLICGFFREQLAEEIAAAQVVILS